MFKPNELKVEGLGNLEDWQLLVAACHFGPAMSDCVEIGYGYTLEEGVVYAHVGGDKISLEDDIDTDKPMEALNHYAGFNLNDAIRNILKDSLSED